MTLRLAISVEGPTENELCREVLRPHLAAFDVHIESIIVTTKRNLTGPNATGGSIGMERFRNEVRRLMPSFDYVTTLYDLYGFKDRLPGATAAALCARMSETLDQPRRLIPYVQPHEVEALLFSAPEALATYLESASLGQAIAAAAKTCGGVEQINDGRDTAPSKRLASLFHEHLGKRYDKPFHGPLLAIEIGLGPIRRACPSFNEWISRLERLSTDAAKRS